MLTIALVAPAKMGNLNYKYNPYDAAIYAAFSPMSWCTIFAWIIFTTHIGYSSTSISNSMTPDQNLIRSVSFPISAVISDILSCRLFLVTTRLAYAVYLTQFPIFFFNVGTTKHSGYYHFITSTVMIVYFIFHHFNRNFFLKSISFFLLLETGKFIRNIVHSCDIGCSHSFVWYTVPKHQEVFISEKWTEFDKSGNEATDSRKQRALIFRNIS